MPGLDFAYMPINVTSEPFTDIEVREATAPGDLIALLDTGAYSLEEMLQYCGRQHAKAIMIAADDSVITSRDRDRDRPEDLVDAAEWKGMVAAE